MLQTLSLTQNSLSRLCGTSWNNATIVDISSLVGQQYEEIVRPRSSGVTPRSESRTPSISTDLISVQSSLKRPIAGIKRSATMSELASEQPAKKQSKWSAEEDEKIIELRGQKMKWEDISQHLPGRSAISCRLHYQNYLEKRSTWDDDRKNKLARLYERFKEEMWEKIAKEMGIPWRAVEGMHWQMGQTEMARRAGVNPFALTDKSDGQSGISSGDETASRQGPQQLPSLSELTAGTPAPAPYPGMACQSQDRIPGSVFGANCLQPRPYLGPPSEHLPPDFFNGHR